MSVGDERLIVKELDRWAAGELGAQLTWAKLEERYGYSRQSLNQKPAIKAAYKVAKESLAGGLVKSRESAEAELAELHRRIAVLEAEVTGHRRRETQWLARWQRIAFHIRRSGVQVHQVDKAAGEPAPSERETANILHPFDKEIPSPYPDEE